MTGLKGMGTLNEFNTCYMLWLGGFCGDQVGSGTIYFPTNEVARRRGWRRGGDDSPEVLLRRGHAFHQRDITKPHIRSLISRIHSRTTPTVMAFYLFYSFANAAAAAAAAAIATTTGRSEEGGTGMKSWRQYATPLG